MAARFTKKVQQLTRRDLLTCPVWEFIAEPRGKETEESLRPRKDITRLSKRALNASFLLAVAAEFHLANGAVLRGFFTPELNSEAAAADFDYLGSAQPVLFGSKGQVRFWFGGSEPSNEQRLKLLAKLGKQPSPIFPIRYRATVPYDAGIRGEGVIPGVLYMETEYVFMV